MKSRSSIGRSRWRVDAGGALTAWAAGPWERGEFAALREELDPERAWRDVATLGAAVDEIAHANGTPEVVLLAQPRPGVDEQELVDRLHAAAPLARVVVVAGSWCEGELRTGRPLVGVTRLYWHELPAWWRQSIARRAEGLAPHWSAVGERRIDGEAALSSDRAPATIAVDATDFAAYEALDAALRPCGWSCIWTPRGRGAEGHAAGIWDGGQLDAAEQSALERFCRAFVGAPAPVMALVDYPRPEHWEAIVRVGAGALLGKPYRIASLADQLVQLTQGMPRASLERVGASARG